MDQNGRVSIYNNPDPRGNIVLNPFNLNWNFLHHNYCEEASRIITLGQFICENSCIAKNGPHLKSGQVLIVQIDSVVIRSAKAYLAILGATVHGHYGEILYKGDVGKTGFVSHTKPTAEATQESTSFMIDNM